MVDQGPEVPTEKADQHRRLIQHGKWSQPDVPHKGWLCVGVEDLGVPSQICEMCEFQEIRYVHRMWHPGYTIGLDVGCDCAGFMSGDYEGTEGRDREMRNRASRLRAFLNRGWLPLGSGRSVRAMHSVEITVGPHSKLGWTAHVRDMKTRRFRTSKQAYATEAEVKVAAFKVLEGIRSRRAEESDSTINEMIETAGAGHASPKPQPERPKSEQERLRKETELRIGMRIVNGRLRPI